MGVPLTVLIARRCRVDCNHLLGSARIWPAWVGGRRPCRPCHLATPPHRLAGEDAGASRGKPWPPRHLTRLPASVEPASGGTMPQVAPAGATTASGYQGTDDLTVTERGPPAERCGAGVGAGSGRGANPPAATAVAPGSRGGGFALPAPELGLEVLPPADDIGGLRWPALHLCRGVLCPPQARPSRAYRPAPMATPLGAPASLRER
jgi:hypothetical protein